jgi:hypothetical protein
VWRRVARDDFSALGGQDGRFLMANADGDYHHVCEDYELRPAKGRAQNDSYSRRVVPRYGIEDDAKWKTYRPLEDAPDLFLRFARLYEQERSAQTVLSWTRQYGLLGTEHPGNVEPTEETLSLFFREVDRAAAVLSMYEAVLNRDSDAAEHATRRQFQSVAEPHRDEFWSSSGMAEEVPGHLGFALAVSAFEVSSMVGRFVRLTLAVESGMPSPSRVRAGYGFYSLLGAMYLQMYWLMNSGSAVVHCEYCGRTISLSRPNPGGRKRRADRRFCDDACRQAHHRAKKES